MNKTLITGALAAMLIAAPAFAQQSPTLDRVLRELDALSKRVDRLEQDNQKLESENAELKASNDRLEATTDYLRVNASATRKELAEDAPVIAKIADLEKSAKAADWASRISWKGDLRYRHENVDPFETLNDQTRQRVRARVGMTAKVNDTISATVQLATGGGTNDPRSTNQTLGSGFDRKQIGLDLAYVDWAPVQGFNVQLGKMPWPFQRVGSYFWDNDITPEGGAIKFGRGAFFGSAFGYWLSESTLASDSNVVGAQLGFKGSLGSMNWTAAAMYYDLGAVQNEVTAIIAPSAMAPGICAAGLLNNTFFGGAQGNTTFNAGDNCNRLLNDYNIYQVMAQAEFKLGSVPLVVFADYAENNEAEDLSTAYSAGLTLGRASNPMTWEFGYIYQVTEKDALFGQFVDSDFGGGITDVDGSVLKLGFAPAKNWVLNGTYFMNGRFVDVPLTVAGTPRTDIDYDRYQIDFNVKF